MRTRSLLRVVVALSWQQGKRPLGRRPAIQLTRLQAQGTPQETNVVASFGAFRGVTALTGPSLAVRLPPGALLVLLFFFVPVSTTPPDFHPPPCYLRRDSEMREEPLQQPALHVHLGNKQERSPWIAIKRGEVGRGRRIYGSTGWRLIYVHWPQAVLM